MYYLSGGVNFGVCPSYTLQELSKSPEMLQYQGCLELALFGGCPLDKDAWRSNFLVRTPFEY